MELFDLFNKSNFNQTSVEVSQSAINHNIEYYKNKIGSANKLAAVIKGNGYGHGLQEMGYLCEKNNAVSLLCTANLSEALLLRSRNISKSILVLGYADCNPMYAIKKNIAFMIDTLEYANMLNEIAKEHSYQFKVHIKVDTGLSRLGIFPHEALSFIKQIQKYPYLTIDGIYSHFVAATSDSELTEKQLNTFIKTIENILNENITINNIHMSNSGSLEYISYPSFFNMFRVGLGLYGLGEPKNMLAPALTWKTHIVSIKIVPTGSYISYAKAYKAARPTRVAILPIGYQDGYEFRFSNKTSIHVNGQLAPMLGRVAMNMIMVDVTDCNAQINDEVLICGPHNGVSADDLANTANMDNIREILTKINPSIPRVIVP
jgi:alanine racemase